MDVMEIEPQILQPIIGTYGVQLYTDNLCQTPNPDNAAYLRSAIVPSGCINVYHPNPAHNNMNNPIQGGIPPVGALHARGLAFVNDPENPQGFKLCAYNTYDCDEGPIARARNLMYNWFEFTANLGCVATHRGLLGSSFKVIDANDQCVVDHMNIEANVANNDEARAARNADPARNAQ